MVNTLLASITSLLDKEFLFASFLPALLFVGALGLCGGLIVGIPTAADWFSSLGASDAAWLSGIASVLVVVFAYVLVGFRPAFTGFLCGQWRFFLWGFAEIGRWFYRGRFESLRRRTSQAVSWGHMAEKFAADVNPQWDQPNRPKADSAALERVRAAARLQEGADEVTVERQLEVIVVAFKQYDSEALKVFFADTRSTLLEWDRTAKHDAQVACAIRDRSFGSAASICPTELGNIIASYNEYSFQRYNIEAEIFWPRLQSVMKPEYAALVRDARIQFDFCVTNSVLCLVLGSAAVLGGPWLWFNPTVWTLLPLGALVLSYAFYRLAVVTANAFGDLVRSSFDLFRLDLMSALGRVRPTSFEEERAQWEELSQLAVYGTIVDFDIAPKGT